MARRLRAWGWATLTAAVFVGVEAALVGVLRTRGRLVLAPGPASLDEVIGVGAAAVALMVGGWLAVSCTASVLAHAPGHTGATAGRVATACAPLLTRRVAAALVGVAMGSTLAPATALAQDATPSPGFAVTAPATSVRGATSAPPPGWTPSRPVQRPVAAPDLVSSGVGAGVGSGVSSAAGPRGGAGVGPGLRSTARELGAPQDGHEVVVHRGDTLWELAARHLGPDATDAEVAAAWPRWHETNRSVIGADPDLLKPGQVLVVPRSGGGR